MLKPKRLGRRRIEKTQIEKFLDKEDFKNIVEKVRKRESVDVCEKCKVREDYPCTIDCGGVREAILKQAKKKD